MISQVILSLLVISSLHQASDASLEQDSLDDIACIKETGVDEALAKNYHGGSKDLPTDSKFKCYLTCTAKKYGIIENGKILYEELVNQHEPRLRAGVRSEVDKCKIAHPTGTCEDYYNFHKCFHA